MISNVLFYLALRDIAAVLLILVVVSALVLLTSPLGPALLVAVVSSIANGNGMDMLEALAAGLIVLLPSISVYLKLLMAWEANSPTPEMVPQVPYWVVKEKSDGEPMGNYAWAFYENNDLDDSGLMANTVIEIVRVYDEDGNATGWRVTLPSTMDWMLPVERSQFFDHGGANDLASNLMLILSPDQQAAYERMVLDAMADAGIAPTDPVMLVGFSQGGILAGKLASQDNGFNIEAVVTAGAPIDAYDIPDGVSVISMQHTNDIVARLDGTPALHGDNWQTIEVPPPPNLPDHNGGAYVITAGSHARQPRSSDAALAAVIHDQERFFSDNEVAVPLLRGRRRGDDDVKGRRFVVPVAVALAVAPLLAGCGPSSEEDAQALETVVVGIEPGDRGRPGGVLDQRFRVATGREGLHPGCEDDVARRTRLGGRVGRQGRLAGVAGRSILREVLGRPGRQAGRRVVPPEGRRAVP